MKIAQIGVSGHFMYAYPTMKKYGLTLDALFYEKDEDFGDIAPALDKFGFSPKIYGSAAEMLDTEKPDIAIINTLFYKNCLYARECVKRGIHVFCEKPAALTENELDALISEYESVNKSKRTLYVPMYGIMYLPHFYTAAKYVKSGLLGDIRLANAQKSYKLGKRPPIYSERETYGGLIPWVAIHAIDWTVRLGAFGPVSVTAYHSSKENGGNGDMEVSSLSLFECGDGKIFSVSADMLRPSGAPTHDDDRLRLVGTKGILEVCAGKVSVINADGVKILENEPPEHELFEELLLDIEGKMKCGITASDAFYTTRLALDARKSADTDKRVYINE